MSEADAVRLREQRQAAKRRGVCLDCRRRSSRPGRTTCEECAAAETQRRRRRLRERAAGGLCARCGKGPRDAGTICQACKRRLRGLPSAGANATRQARAKERLCRDGCGRSAFAKSRCKECSALAAQKQKDRLAARAAARLCYRCGREPAIRHRSCKRCRRSRRNAYHASKRRREAEARLVAALAPRRSRSRPVGDEPR